MVCRFFILLNFPIPKHPTIMSVVIAATDHSPIGDHAAHYAAALAMQWGYRLVVVHAYYIPVTFNDPALPIVPPNDLMDVAKSRMAKMADGIRMRFPELQLDTRVEYGDIQDVLEDMVEELAPALLVTGSHGDDDADMWMGSTTLRLLRHMQCPVLAVPPTMEFQDIQHICLALDLSHATELPAHTLAQLQQQTGAMLHLLHVGKEGTDTAQLQPAGLLPELRTMVHHTTTDGNIDQKIAEFCDTQGMQWLAIIPQHHSFWESLFHKSHTKGVMRTSHVPVLALHAI